MKSPSRFAPPSARAPTHIVLPLSRLPKSPAGEISAVATAPDATMGMTDTVASPGEVTPVAAFAPAVAPTVEAVPGAATVGTVSLREGASTAERVLGVVGTAETVAADAETRAPGAETDGEDGEDVESAST